MTKLYGLIINGEHKGKHGDIIKIDSNSQEYTLCCNLVEEITITASDVRVITRPQDIKMDLYIDWN